MSPPYRTATALLLAATLCFTPVAASLSLREFAGTDLLPSAVAAILLSGYCLTLGSALGRVIARRLLRRRLSVPAALLLILVQPGLWRRAVEDPSYPAWLPAALLGAALGAALRPLPFNRHRP